MATDSSIEPGKIFVGGLSWDTKKDGLQKYFEQFGEVADANVMYDRNTGNPKGFGFVTFKDTFSVDKVLAISKHELDSKQIDPKRAVINSKPPSAAGVQTYGNERVKKIFVGGIAAGTTEEEIREYFSQYGTITDIDLKVDKTTQRMRGFGFVGFESEDVVDKICQEHFHQIKEKMVEAKKAMARGSLPPSSGSRYGGGMHGDFHAQGYGAPAGYAARGGYGAGGTQYGGYSYGSSSYPQQQQQQQQYAYNYSGYSQPSYGGQYGAQTSGYGAYDAYASGQPTRTTGDQTRSDYSSTGYAYGGQGHMQHDMYGNRSTTGYASSTDSYGTGAYNYGHSGTYNYQDPSAVPGAGYGGRGGGRGNSYGAQ